MPTDTFTCKLRTTGGSRTSLSVTIPARIAQMCKLKQGMLVYGRIKHNDESKTVIELEIRKDIILE